MLVRIASVSLSLYNHNHPTTRQIILTIQCIVVFSKTWCPYCKATKQTLNDLKAQYEVVELDNRSSSPLFFLCSPLHISLCRHANFGSTDDGDELQDALLEISGQRSVPNIFFGKKHIGGNSDLQALAKSGQLKARLEEVGAFA
jgi:glutaredoxin 3